MGSEDLARLQDQFAQLYPPLITTDEAAAIARVPVTTIYDWSSRGRLDAIKTRSGKRVCLHRDAFVKLVTKGIGRD